jgi:hypothetical protein
MATKVERRPKCPGCGKTGTIYGMPWGLQIGSHVKGENSDVYGVVIVMCGECGTAIGASPYPAPSTGPTR